MSPRSLRGRIALFAVVLALTALGGCVERRMTVRTNPPGAQLYVDDYEIGTTPCSVDFTYYGTRKIRLVKDGYETAVIKQPVPAPWYQYFPIDFVTENLVPGHIRDERVVTYQMQPAAQIPTDQLVSRADALRQNTHLAAAANAQVRVTPPPRTIQPAPQPPNTLPAPIETIPAPGPAPFGQPAPGTQPPVILPGPSPVPSGSPLPSNNPPPGSYPQPGSYLPPSGYAPPGGYPTSPIYGPAPSYGPAISQPSR